MFFNNRFKAKQILISIILLILSFGFSTSLIFANNENKLEKLTNLKHLWHIKDQERINMQETIDKLQKSIQTKEKEMKEVEKIAKSLKDKVLTNDSFMGHYKITTYYTPQKDQKRYYNGSYLRDYFINCSGNCLITASGYNLKNEDANKILACPSNFKFGTQFYIESIGIVRCEDRGGKIYGKHIDLWSGIGDNAKIGEHDGYKKVWIIQ